MAVLRNGNFQIVLTSIPQPEQYLYNVKVMNSEKAKDIKLFTWHDVHEIFQTHDKLKEKLREDFGEHIPRSDFDVVFFE